MDLRLIFSACLFVSLCFFTSAIEIGQDGGYSLRVAIHQDEAEPSIGVAAYIENIKNNYRRLGSDMWKATDETFWIKSVDIIVPPSWSISEATENAMSYSMADIRVSSMVDMPMANNPNMCGLPGDYIELPASFHEQANSGDYGDNVKAILALWARYRWGAYEEHGYPGSTKFPYFSKVENAVDDQPKWVATGCTNAPNNMLNGTYLNLDGSQCDATTVDMPGSTCRFVPDRAGNDAATTSLMHFHFLDSVNKFCDETNHVKDVKNKQNILCGGKSVMETIRSSPDYKMVTDKQSFVKTPTFSVTKPFNHPALYLLFDRAMHTDEIASALTRSLPEVANQFANLIGNKPSGDLLVGLGHFPVSGSDAGVQEILPLGPLMGRDEQFIQELANVKILPVMERDFGRAIIGAVEKIQASGTIRGGAILLVKSGGASNDSMFTYESDVEMALRAQGVSLFAVEVTRGESDMNLNLEHLATNSKGMTRAVRAEEDYEVEQMVQDVWAALQSLVVGNSAPELEELRTIFDMDVASGFSTKVEIPQGAESATIQLTSAEELNNITVTTEDPATAVTFTSRMEYGSTKGSRHVYTGMLNTTNEDIKSVTVRVNDGTLAKLTITAVGGSIQSNAEVTVSTNALNDRLDLGAVSNPNAPFVIYAMVTLDGVPVQDASVDAVLETSTGVRLPIHMLDDGSASAADTVANDGTYSQVIVPPADGSYKITVTAMKTKSSDAKTVGEIAGNTRLLPIKQDIPEEVTVPAPGGIFKVATYGNRIEVLNREKYKAVIGPITNLKVDDTEGTADVKFSFTAPKIVGVEHPPEQYKFYRSASQEALENLNLDAALPEGVESPFSESNMISPGNTVTVAQTVLRDSMFYYAVAAFNGTAHSDLSAVVNVSDLGGEEDDEVWLKSTAGIITVVAVVLGCFIAAGAVWKYMERKRSKKAAGTRFVRPGDQA